MPVGDKCWVEYSEKLRKRMFQEGVFAVTIPMEEIHSHSRTAVAFADLQTAGYWNPCRDAKPGWDTYQRNGIELDFNVEADGYVHFVTFRLDATRRASLQRTIDGRDRRDS